MNVYQYYRDLLNFRQRGDPALMLRCINPAEAKLADSAAGIHVKFRLAGVSSHWCDLISVLKSVHYYSSFDSEVVRRYLFLIIERLLNARKKLTKLTMDFFNASDELNW